KGCRATGTPFLYAHPHAPLPATRTRRHHFRPVPPRLRARPRQPAGHPRTMKPNSLTPLIAAGAIVLVVVTATFVLRGRDGPSAPAAGASAAIEAVDAAAAGQAPPSARQPPSDRLQGTPVVHPQD